MLTKQQFQLKLLNDFTKKYPLSRIANDILRINYAHLEMSIPLADAYDEYRVSRNYKVIRSIYLSNIEKMLSQYEFKVNYDSVYPLIKSADFGHGEPINFVKEHFALDLNIFYVCDMGETFRFLLKEDEYDFEQLKKAANKNLNKLSNILVKLDEDVEIYTLNYSSDYAASFLLADNIRKQIYKRVGEDFLFAIPTSTTLLVARDIRGYIDILKGLIKIDPDPNKVSSNVYMYKNGNYMYADMKSNLKIIK